MILTEETEVLGAKPLRLPPFPPETSHGLVWDRTRSSVVTGP